MPAPPDSRSIAASVTPEIGPGSSPPEAGGIPVDSMSLVEIKQALEKQKADEAAAQIKAQPDAKAQQAADERKAEALSIGNLALHSRLQELEKRLSEAELTIKGRLTEAEHTLGHLIGFVIHGQHSRLASIHAWLHRVFGGSSNG